jgi:hypothetical protein
MLLKLATRRGSYEYKQKVVDVHDIIESVLQCSSLPKESFLFFIPLRPRNEHRFVRIVVFGMNAAVFPGLSMLLEFRYLYCLHPVVLEDKMFKGSNGFLSAQLYFYCFILSYVHITTRINALLVRHVSTCIGHLQVTVKRNEVFTYIIAVGDVVYTHPYRSKQSYYKII